MSVPRIRIHSAPGTSTRPDWRDHAACRAYNDPEAWFPVGNTGTALLEIEEAKRVCRTCPVMEQCGDYALTHRIEDGVWGGMSEAERRSILRRRSYLRAKNRRGDAA